MKRLIHLNETWWATATQEDRDYVQSEIRTALSRGVVVISFTKADGTKRLMQATTSSQIVPPAPVTENAKPARSVNPDTHHVWDVEANGWRSFRWDRLRGAEFNS